MGAGRQFSAAGPFFLARIENAPRQYHRVTMRGRHRRVDSAVFVAGVRIGSGFYGRTVFVGGGRNCRG